MPSLTSVGMNRSPPEPRQLTADWAAATAKAEQLATAANLKLDDFANISAESNMSDMTTLSFEEITEANAWFDARNEQMDNDEIPMSF